MGVRVDIEDDIMVVTLSRVDALNALGPLELAGLLAAIARGDEPEVRAVVLTGEGRAFCAGIDLKASTDSTFFRQVLRRQLHPIILGLLALEKPIVTAVNGVAAGAGMSLVLVGDVRIGSPASSFVSAFAALGLSPDAGFTSLAIRAMGYDRAVSFVLGGERWSVERALEGGLLTRIVDEGELHRTAVGVATALSRAPLATSAATLRLLRAASLRSLAAQLEAEADAQHALLADSQVADYLEAQRERIVGHRA